MSKLLQRTVAALVSPETVSRETSGVVWVPLSQIVANPYQTRISDDPEHIISLAKSILDQKRALPNTLGLQQLPMGRLIDRLPSGGYVVASAEDHADPEMPLAHSSAPALVQLAFGHSRWAAFRLLAHGPDVDFLPTLVGAEQLLPGDLDYISLPVRIVRLDDMQMWEQAVEENAKRKNINAIEEARSMQKALKDFNLLPQDVGRPFGYARSTVVNKLRLLDLPDEVQQQIITGQISEKHGRTLLRMADAPDVLLTLASDAATLSTRELEATVEVQRKRVDLEREKQRQADAVSASAFGFGVDRIRLDISEWTPYLFGATPWAPSELVTEGYCKREACECFNVVWVTNPNENSLRPCPADAPNMCYACTGGFNAVNEKRRAWDNGKSEHQVTDQARQKREEEDRRRDEQVEANHREARQLVAEFIAQVSTADMWVSAEMWKRIFSGVSYSLQHELRTVFEVANDIHTMQNGVAYTYLLGLTKYDKKLDRNTYDLNEIKARIKKHGGAVAPVRPQPGPGDSQATFWQEGWSDEDEGEWRMLAAQSGPSM
jgi:ParB-like chromosome segregation protein Spo0J